MKKILFGLTLLALISASCQKNEDSPGNIPGMGNTAGDLQVKEPFTLPDGIKIIGDITGLDNSGAKSEDAKTTYYCYGSGGKMIKLRLTLANTGTHPRTVFFPKGLLWKCRVPGYQSAILCQTTWVSLQPNAQRTIYVDLYCINYGLSPSDHNSTFQIVGITSSTVIQDLLKMIGWRKINYEWIYGTFQGGNKGNATEPTYEEITERIQDIVWDLTNNGTEIAAEDKAFIESIPELPSSEIPTLDANSQFPEYFKDFLAPVE